MANYDPNKDYSAALSNPNLSATERAQLTAEREAKIADMYGGKEPNMDGSNQTFSSAYGRDGSGVTSGGGTVRSSNTPAGEIGSGVVYQGGLGGDSPGTAVAKAKTPDGRIIDVVYVDGVRQTDIPDGTIVRTNGGDFVYNAPKQTAPKQTTMTQPETTPAPTISPISNRAPDLQATLDKWLTAAQQQARLQADYAVSQGVNELQRAEEDAKAQFQTQRNQIAATEAKASDNQALYNERRGDRGGIGAAQYDAIANTAAQNQLAVNQAQVKLSTDTARQIADLRAQGEFQKADALLSLSQTYLQQLISIQQWGAEFNLSVDQFNKQLEQWNNEFEVKVADLLGEYRGAQTLASQSLDLQRRAQSFDEEYRTAGLTGIFRGGQTLESRKMLADSGYALAASGVMPSESQRAALQELYGYDTNAVDALVQTAKLAEQAKITPSKAPSNSPDEKKTSGISLTTAKEMAEAGHFTEESVEKLHAAGYSDAYLEDQYGYRPNSADSTDVKFGSGISTKAPAGFSRSEWDNVVYVVGRYLKNQQTAEALAYFDSVSERLNKEQWNTLAELFASYSVSAAPPVYY